MRILIAYRYFAPDTPPYASMLAQYAQWLTEAGHEVEVLTAQPAYKPSANVPRQPWQEKRRNLTVRRVWLLPEQTFRAAKIVNSVLFVLRAWLIVQFGPRRDLIWTATMPPVMQAWALSLAAKARGARFLYHMQDIHPEIAFALRGGETYGPLFRLLRSLDVATLRRADRVVVIGHDMMRTLEDRGARTDNVRVLRNFALGDECEDAEPPVRSTVGEPVRFVFAGNIGRFQGLERVVDAFGEIDPLVAELLFVGDGRAKTSLAERIGRKRWEHVRFRPHMSETEVYALLRTQDVGLVSLSPGLSRYAFPSKVWTYLSADLPILGLVERESDLDRFVSAEQLGACVPIDSPIETIVQTILEVARRVRSHGYCIAERTELYQRSAARPKWLALVEELAPEQGPD